MSENIDLDAAPASRMWRRWWRMLSAVGIAAFTLIIAHLFFTHQYRTNDDVGMAIIAAGVWRNPTPSPYLLYVHVFLGYVISALYTVSPDLPIYRLAMLTIHATASATIYWAILPSSHFHRRFRARTVLIFIFAACVDLPLYVQPQFTLISLHCGVAALSVWLTFTTRNTAMSWRAGLVFVVLVVLCALVRAHAGIVNVACFAPAILAVIWFQSSSWLEFSKNLLKQAAPAAALVAIILGLSYAHESIYSRAKGWETFSEYNMLRAEYIDYRTIEYNELNKPVFEEAGWSKVDFLMFKGWFFLDEERYSLEKMKWLSAHTSKVRQSRSYPSIASVIDAVFVQQKEVYYLTLILFIPFLFFDYRKYQWLAYSTYGVGVISLCAVIIIVLDRFPPHVYLGFFEYIFVVGCLLVTEGFLRFRGSLFQFSERKLKLLETTKRKQTGQAGIRELALRKMPESFQLWVSKLRLCWTSATMFELPLVQAILVLIVSYICTSSAVRYQYEFSKEVAIYQKAAKKGLEGFQPTSDVLYIVTAISYPLQHHNPLDNFKAIRNARVIQLGTATRSAFTEDRMKEFGVTDVYRAILERDDVRIIASPTALKLFLGSAKERLGKVYEPKVMEKYFIPNSRNKSTIELTAYNFTPKAAEDSGNSKP
ncbi:MAG: hypothetical protein NXI22_04290 [bacterium]|nr:hypothetical protein [bacterium]